jgi:sugar fermentation stimulation protein A
VCLFLVNRNDCSSCGPADDIDPDYGRLLRQANAQGVEILAWQASYQPTRRPKQVTVEKSIPMVW